ncbi:MAG: sigma-70 family RNA polymerase sigma factor [Ilumatobacteraceae bacterium]
MSLLAHRNVNFTTTMTGRAAGGKDVTMTAMGRFEAGRFETWVTRVAETAMATARRRGIDFHDAADVAQEIVLGALRSGPALMQQYPDAQVYAAVRLRHAHVTWLRSEGVQRAEGARRDRRVQSIDAVYDDGSTIDIASADDDVCDAVIRGIEANEVRCLLGSYLDDRDADLVLEIKGHGVSVADHARQHGLARETVSRRLGRASRRLVEADLSSHSALAGAFTC